MVTTAKLLQASARLLATGGAVILAVLLVSVFVSASVALVWRDVRDLARKLRR